MCNTKILQSNFVVLLLYQARLAQSVEHETLNLRVVGSSPTLGDFLLFPKSMICFNSILSKIFIFGYNNIFVCGNDLEFVGVNFTFYVCRYQARLAQSVEHETLNLRVVGSSPTLGVFYFLSKLNFNHKNVSSTAIRFCL